MASLSVTIENHTGNALEILNRIQREWTPEKADAFADEWYRLEGAGAQMVEVRFMGGRIIAHPSEEFTRHLEKWGVASW